MKTSTSIFLTLISLFFYIIGALAMEADVFWNCQKRGEYTALFGSNLDCKQLPAPQEEINK